MFLWTACSYILEYRVFLYLLSMLYLTHDIYHVFLGFIFFCYFNYY